MPVRRSTNNRAANATAPALIRLPTRCSLHYPLAFLCRCGGQYDVHILAGVCWKDTSQCQLWLLRECYQVCYSSRACRVSICCMAWISLVVHFYGTSGLRIDIPFPLATHQNVQCSYISGIMFSRAVSWSSVRPFPSPILLGTGENVSFEIFALFKFKGGKLDIQRGLILFVRDVNFSLIVDVEILISFANILYI